MGQPSWWALRRFEYLSFLGRGGMGAVYQVRDRELGARVALKTVGQVEGQALLRFKREFRAIRELYHPNIVQLGELFAFDGDWAYTMELVHGVDFVRYVRGTEGSPRSSSSETSDSSDPSAPDRSGEVPSTRKLMASQGRVGCETRLQTSFAQLIEALRFLHGHGHVHCDVKPSNVLVTDEGRVVLLDFGLLKERYAERVAPEGEVAGTAVYMAPEQAAGESVTPAADWYAAGVMLYEALTGSVPFDGSPATVLLHKQVYDAPPPTVHKPDLSSHWVELCRAMLSRDPRARPSADTLLLRLGQGVSTRPSFVHWLRPIARKVECVGRGAELEQLRTTFEAWRGQQACAVLVEGPSGIGKTTLVKHFTEQLENSASTPVSVLRSTCREYEEVSFKAFDELFDALSNQLTRGDLALLRDDHVAALRRAFPVLERVPAIAQAQPGSGDQADPKQLRLTLYAAVRRVMRGLARTSSLVLVLENVHWADADSRALIRELLRGPDAPPLFLVMTARPEVSTTEAVSELKERVALTRLELSALAPSDARALVHRELSGSLLESDALVSGIVREAKGHPLLITTMARFAHAHGAQPSLTLSEVIWQDIESLPELGYQMLVAVSLMGGAAERRLLAVALEADASEVAELSSKLVALRLLRAAGANGASLEPHHDQVRATVFERLSGEERSRWHARLARALEAHGEGREAAVYHYREAGDVASAAEAAERAAERACAALAFERAVRMLELSLSLNEDESAQRRLWVKLASALSLAGRNAEAADAYLAGAAREADERALELEREAAVHLLSAGELARGKALLGEVLGKLGLPMPTSTWSALLRTLFLRARLRMRGTGYTLADRPQLSELALSRLELCASSALVFSTVDPILGSCFGSMYALLALPSRHREHTARALLLEGGYACLVGDRKRGDALIAQAKRAAGPSPSAFLSAFIPAHESAVAWAYSDYRAALRLSRAAHEELRTRCQRVSWVLVTLELVETNALFFRGRYRELARRAAACLRAAEERGDRYGVTNMLLSHASVRHLAQDRVDEAHASVERGATSWTTPHFDMQSLMALQSRVYVCLYRGEHERARSLVLASRPEMGRSLLLRLPTYRVLAWYLECQARLAVAEDTTELDARAELAKADKLAHKLERSTIPLGPALAAVVRAALAGRRAGSPDMARVSEALTRLEALGLDGHAAALRLRTAEALGPGASEAADLRDRALRFMTEQEVARPEPFASVLCPRLDVRRRALPA